MNVYVNDFKYEVMNFLDRQNLKHEESDVEKFIEEFLEDYICWDNLKDDMYDKLFEKFE